MFNLSRHAIRVFANKVGITSLGGSMYSNVRNAASSELDNLVQKTVTITTSRGRSRVQPDDVKSALELIGRTPYHRNCTQVDRRYMSVSEYASQPYQAGRKRHQVVTQCTRKDPTKCPVRQQVSPKTRRASKGMTTRRNIRYAQKQGNCMNFPKASFRRIVRKKAVKYIQNMQSMQFSEEALDMIQTDIEYFLLNLLKNAHNLTLHAGRKTVQPKDLNMATNVVN